MRLQLALLVALALPTLASAQSSSAAAAGAVPPLPPIGLPLPHIGLPFPETTPPSSQTPPRAGGHRGRRGQVGGPGPAVVYVLAPYPWLYAPEPESVSTPPPRQPTGGCLRLDADAAPDQQFFVDGIYVGTQNDFGLGDEGVIAVEAGTHILQVMSSGYETLQVSLGVTAGRCTTHHARLKRLAEVEAFSPHGPVAPMTGYIIPGCYLGNVPPEHASLPADCDVSRAIVVKP